MEMVCLGYNPSDLFVFCRIAPSLPRTRRRGGRWRGRNISCSPTLLLLNFLVAGKKEAAFLFTPVHRATFLGFPKDRMNFLIDKYVSSFSIEWRNQSSYSYLAFVETSLGSFLFFLGDHGFLVILVELILVQFRAIRR